MIEVERKFRLAQKNIATIKDILKQNSFAEDQSIKQIDSVFLYHMNSFEHFKRGDPTLRIRQTGKEIKITYKRAVGLEGHMIEHEFGIDSPETAEKLFNELGYQLAVTVEKDRIEYHKGEFTVTIDAVKDLGDFLEIEILCNDDNERVTAQDKITELADKLSLSTNEIEPSKYDQLIAALKIK